MTPRLLLPYGAAAPPPWRVAPSVVPTPCHLPAFSATPRVSALPPTAAPTTAAYCSSPSARRATLAVAPPPRPLSGRAWAGAPLSAAAAAAAVWPRRLPPGGPTMRSKRETRKNPPPPGGGSGGGGASRAAANNAPPPARVDANLNLSLRAQLRAAKAAAAEAAAAAPGGGTGKPKPALRTKFRRNKDDEAVVEAWTAKQRRKAEERKRMPDGKYVVGPAPLCFIDGYNIIGWWPQLKKRRDAGDMDGARRRLMGYVEEFATVRGWECVVVFDANNTEERAKSEAFSDAVSVVYTGSETADSYIEAATLVACRNAQRQVWAATSDFAQAKLAGAQGAHVISSRLFSAELTSARREARENATAADDIGEARGRAMLINTVDPSVRDALYKLRDQLDG